MIHPYWLAFIISEVSTFSTEGESIQQSYGAVNSVIYSKDCAAKICTLVHSGTNVKGVSNHFLDRFGLISSLLNETELMTGTDNSTKIHDLLTHSS